MLTLFFRIILILSFVSFSLSLHAEERLFLPPAGAILSPSFAFLPARLVGIQVDTQNPFRFNFFMSSGDQDLTAQTISEESEKLVRYFLAAMTVPEEEQWVNLSPYEKNRIVGDSFGKTEMGRDLLAQDYVLKQIMASLIYPETDLGKRFWNDVYRKAQETFGTTDIPFDVFHKVWISPDKALFYESGNTAFLLEAKMKVQLEEDYLEQKKESLKYKDDMSKSHISPELRALILPVIEKEINEGESFALLRKVYSSMLLAAWYKRKVKEGILSEQYVDKGKTAGVSLDDSRILDDIYQQYIAAFKQGVFNYIKDEWDPFSGDILPRRYFSGGFSPDFSQAISIVSGEMIPTGNFLGREKVFRIGVLAESVSPLKEFFIRNEGVETRDAAANPVYIRRLGRKLVVNFFVNRHDSSLRQFLERTGTSESAFYEDLENTKRRFFRSFLLNNDFEAKLLKKDSEEEVYGLMYEDNMMILRKILSPVLLQTYEKNRKDVVLTDCIFSPLGKGLHQVVLQPQDDSLERKLHYTMQNFAENRLMQLIHLGKARPIDILQDEEKVRLLMGGVEQEFVGMGGNHRVFRNKHMAIRVPIRNDRILQGVKDGFRIVQQEGVGPAWVAVLKASNGKEVFAVDWLTGKSLDMVVAEEKMDDLVFRALISLFNTLLERGILINDPRAANFMLNFNARGEPEVVIVDADLVEYSSMNPYHLAMKYAYDLIPMYAKTWGDSWAAKIVDAMKGFAEHYQDLEEKKNYWQQDPLHRRISSDSYVPETVGGIDMSTRNMSLDIENNGQRIHFNINPAYFPTVSEGLSPRIVGIDRVSDLSDIIGIIKKK